MERTAASALLHGAVGESVWVSDSHEGDELVQSRVTGGVLEFAPQYAQGLRPGCAVVFDREKHLLLRAAGVPQTAARIRD